MGMYNVIFNVQDGGSPKRLSGWLDNMYDDGWELVSANSHHYIFKRIQSQVVIVGSDVGQSIYVNDITDVDHREGIISVIDESSRGVEPTRPVIEGEDVK